MSLLIPESGLVFWMLLSFGVVFVVLAKYGFPIITGMVEERKAAIDQSLENARLADERLARLKVESDALVAAAEKEQTRILREAMQEREHIIGQARQQAEETVRKEMAVMREQMQREREEAIRDIRRQVALLSVEIAEKIIRRHLSDEKEQLAMIDRMLDEVTQRENSVNTK